MWGLRTKCWYCESCNIHLVADWKATETIHAHIACFCVFKTQKWFPFAFEQLFFRFRIWRLENQVYLFVLRHSFHFTALFHRIDQFHLLFKDWITKLSQGNCFQYRQIYSIETKISSILLRNEKQKKYHGIHRHCECMNFCTDII